LLLPAGASAQLVDNPWLDAAYWFIEGEGTVHDPGRAASDFTWRGVATGDERPPTGFQANDFTVPTLDELLEAFPDVWLNIELKPTVAMTGPPRGVRPSQDLEALRRHLVRGIFDH
jgi:hypothetical protein